MIKAHQVINAVRSKNFEISDDQLKVLNGLIWTRIYNEQMKFKASLHVGHRVSLGVGGSKMCGVIRKIYRSTVDVETEAGNKVVVNIVDLQKMQEARKTTDVST